MINEETILIAVGVTVSVGVAYFYFRHQLQERDEFPEHFDLSEFMIVEDEPVEPEFSPEDDDVCVENVNNIFMQAIGLYNQQVDEAFRFSESFHAITDRISWYDIDLVGNWEFEDASKYGWENSEQNPNGDLPAPEWSDEVFDIWWDGDHLYTPEEWHHAFMALTHWRADNGMQPHFEAEPIIIDPFQWSTCSEWTSEQAEEYAHIILEISIDETYEYFYPALDDVVNWLDEQWAIQNAEDWSDDWDEEWEKETENWTEEDWARWDAEQAEKESAEPTDEPKDEEIQWEEEQ